MFDVTRIDIAYVDVSGYEGCDFDLKSQIPLFSCSGQAGGICI